MFENLAETFYNNVVATYDEYVAHRDSPEAGFDKHLRTAVTAASALYQFREHLPARFSAAIKNLEQASSDYAHVRGVANASKHKQVTRRPPLVVSAQDIREVTVIARYTDDEGDYTHARMKIDVACTDGSDYRLDPALTRVLNHWGALLKDADVCGYNVRPEPEPAGHRYLTREEASFRLNLEVLEGLDFRQSMQLFKFDNDLGQAIAEDLTGADIQFSIYEPPQHIVDVTMSHPKYGDMTASVTLTKAENLQFHHIQSSAEHESFMQRLFTAHQLEIEKKLGEQIADRLKDGQSD